VQSASRCPQLLQCRHKVPLCCYTRDAPSAHKHLQGMLPPADLAQERQLLPVHCMYTPPCAGRLKQRPPQQQTSQPNLTSALDECRAQHNTTEHNTVQRYACVANSSEGPRRCASLTGADKSNRGRAKPCTTVIHASRSDHTLHVTKSTGRCLCTRRGRAGNNMMVSLEDHLNSVRCTCGL
jgi:hypothetical protein